MVKLEQSYIDLILNSALQDKKPWLVFYLWFKQENQFFLWEKTLDPSRFYLGLSFIRSIYNNDMSPPRRILLLV